MQQAGSTSSVSLRCPQCDARLRASRQLVGATCPCPRCRYRIVVRLPVPSDADVFLVDDGKRGSDK
jgi:hypothetical protein